MQGKLVAIDMEQSQQEEILPECIYLTLKTLDSLLDYLRGFRLEISGYLSSQKVVALQVTQNLINLWK